MRIGFATLIAIALSVCASPAFARVDQWTASTIAEMRAEAELSARDGLRPADYGSDIANMSGLAAETYAISLASDLSRGRVKDRGAHSWYIDSMVPADLELSRGLEAALDAGDLHGWFQSLRPIDPSYEVLQERLQSATGGVERTRLRANLERWRWMPRDLPQGERIIVNVPTYKLVYVRADGSLEAHDVIVGAAKTPTPQLMADATDLVVNPPWNVPASIAKGLRAGGKYKAIKTGSGYRLQQPPGPANALGRYKIEMPNKHAIYLHDTPAKALFAKSARAFSHGCIRVQGIADLAAELTGSEDQPRNLSSILATRKTRWLPLGRTIPVMILYFTTEVQDDGSLKSYPDIYARDAKLVKAMDT